MSLPTDITSIADLVALRARTSGDRPFLVFEDQQFSFAEMDAAMRSLAGGLAEIGVRRGDRVAVLMSNRPEFVVTWFALSLMGAVQVPINTAHRGELLRYMLDQSQCSVAIVEQIFLGALTPIRAQLPSLRAIVLVGDGPTDDLGTVVDWASVSTAPALADPPRLNGSDPAAIMYTSGTTGPSKGAVLPQRYPLRLASIIAKACNYGPDDCLYNALPLFHGNAQFLSAAPALLAGARMVLARRFSASGFWPDIRRYGCTEFNYIGGILPILWKADPSPGDSQSPLRVMMGAGAPRDLFGPFEQRFGVKIIEGYGMSEIGVPLITSLDARRAGSCGRLVDEYEVRLVDNDGEDVADDQAGELLIRPHISDGMMSSYFGMAEATVEAWRELWFHTGDYLKRDAEEFYYFVDRKKDALRRRGENISSFEVERGVAAHPAVLEAAAVGVASDLGEDEVMVCVTLRPGMALNAADLVMHCREIMASFMVPRYVRILDALPKTPTERVRKVELRAAGVTADTYDREAAR